MAGQSASICGSYLTDSCEVVLLVTLSAILQEYGALLLKSDLTPFHMVHVLMLLYVHRDQKTIRDGEPRTTTLTFVQLLNSEVVSATVTVFLFQASKFLELHFLLLF